jgi:MrcB-like, N-terminal domain
MLPIFATLIALLNRDVTTSTQSGTYVVLLIAEDLSAIYATLNQGMTELVNEVGQKAAVRTLKERSETYQAQLDHVTQSGIKLGNEIDLRSDNWRGQELRSGHDCLRTV